jgi:hypothetical protein
MLVLAIAYSVVTLVVFLVIHKGFGAELRAAMIGAVLGTALLGSLTAGMICFTTLF